MHVWIIHTLKRDDFHRVSAGKLRKFDNCNPDGPSRKISLMNPSTRSRFKLFFPLSQTQIFIQNKENISNFKGFCNLWSNNPVWITTLKLVIQSEKSYCVSGRLRTSFINELMFDCNFFGDPSCHYLLFLSFCKAMKSRRWIIRIHKHYKSTGFKFWEPIGAHIRRHDG